MVRGNELPELCGVRSLGFRADDHEKGPRVPGAKLGKRLEQEQLIPLRIQTADVESEERVGGNVVLFALLEVIFSGSGWKLANLEKSAFDGL